MPVQCNNEASKNGGLGMKRRHNCKISKAIVNCSSSGRSSDCVICTMEQFSETPLEVLQIIELLTYHRHEKRARISLLIMVANPSKDQAQRLRIVHRGYVMGLLRRFELSSSDERQSLIRKLYGERFSEVPGVPNAIDFVRRAENCADLQGTEQFSTTGPGDCFTGGRSECEIDRETPHDVDAPFTSFLTPEVGAGERTIFICDLTLSDEAYDRLVKSEFSVDSYTRIKRDIEIEALGGADSKYVKLFMEQIRPERTTIEPRAYDIVISQKLGDPVDVLEGSLYITPVRHPNPELDKQVLWFLGQPREFYVLLTYSGVVPAEKAPSFVVDWNGSSKIRRKEVYA